MAPFVHESKIYRRDRRANCSRSCLSLTLPQEHECVLCYADRQLESFGCDGTLRFAKLYRDVRAPRAFAFEKRLASMGACCCDCELFLNAYRPLYSVWESFCRDLQHELDVEAPEMQNNDQMLESSALTEGREIRIIPPCKGVRKGSTQPCMIWERQP